MIQAVNTFEVLLQARGGFGYAGDDPDPRPLPPTTLGDLKESFEGGLQHAHRRRAQSIHEALYFAFYSDRFQGEPERCITVPRDHLWWLVSAGDTILLSDRITHHYSYVFDVDRDTGRVSFLDQWPDRFFLKEGLNAAGVVAVPVDGKPPSITRKEFRRVAVGLITLDTPSLLEDYFEEHPDQTSDAGQCLSCGLSLLGAQKHRFARPAALHLRRSVRAAEAAGDGDTAAMAAGKLYVALTLAGLAIRRWNEPLASRPFDDELNKLCAERGREVLLSGLAPDDLCRLGNAAGRAGEVSMAEELFDRAVALDATHEQARWLRAIARDQADEPAGAAEDAAEAVRLNRARVAALEAERDGLDPRDRQGRGAIDARIASMKHRRGEEHVLLFRGHSALKRWDEARSAAEDLVALHPDRPEGFKLLAFLEQRVGRLAEARACLKEALRRETSPEVRQALEHALAEISP